LILPANGPFARNVDDLVAASAALYGYNLPPIFKFNDSIYRTEKRLKIGVLESFIFEPAPACRRAVLETAQAYESAGHEVVPFKFPFDPLDAVCTFMALLTADGSKFMVEGLIGEPKSSAVKPFLPNPLNSILINFIRDPRLLRIISEIKLRGLPEALEIQTTGQGFHLKLKEYWESEKLDLIITPGFPIPAFDYDAYVELFYTLIYTGIWNFFNYPAGVVPVSKVDPIKDKITHSILNRYTGTFINRPDFLDAVIEKHYDLEKMAGLPVGVQVVGLPYADELVLRGMKELESILSAKKH